MAAVDEDLKKGLQGITPDRKFGELRRPFLREPFGSPDAEMSIGQRKGVKLDTLLHDSGYREYVFWVITNVSKNSSVGLRKAATYFETEVWVDVDRQLRRRLTSQVIYNNKDKGPQPNPEDVPGSGRSSQGAPVPMAVIPDPATPPKRVPAPGSPIAEYLKIAEAMETIAHAEFLLPFTCAVRDGHVNVSHEAQQLMAMIAAQKS